MSRPTIPRLQILAAAALFSTGGAAIKACTLDSWQVASFRSGVAALFLIAVMPAWRQFWNPRCLVVGIGYASTMILYVTANKLTTAANTIFLQSTAPLYLLVLGPWLLRERLGLRDLVFTVTLAAGAVLFFVGVDPPMKTAPAPLRGNLLGALTGLSWALTILGLRWLGRGQPLATVDLSGAAVVAGNLLAFLIALPLALPVVQAHPVDWLVIAFLGLMQIGLAYICLTRGVRGVSALEVSLLLLLEPVLAAVWAWLAHGERPGPWSLAGCLIILAATAARAFRR